MWNKRLVLPLLLALSLPLPPAFAQTASAPAAAVTQVQISGVVVDANTGVPLSGVYVRQSAALNSTLSDAQGRFNLPLQAGLSGQVRFQVEGYESVALDFRQSQQRLQIELQPLTRFSTQLPSAQQQREPSRRPDQIFGSQFTAFYQLNYTLFNQGEVGLGGLVLNEFGLSTDLQPFRTPLTFRGRFFRSRMPVDVANFPFQPAFYINRQLAKISGGWVYEQEGPFELFLGADLMLDYRSPDNRSSQDRQPVLFTGSLMDYEQTRLGAGATAALGWKLNERWILYPEATVYPLALNFVNRNNDGLLYTVGADLGAKLQFEIIPGAYAVGQYNTQLWHSFGASAFENIHFLHFGISLDPWTMTEGLL